LRQLEVLNKDVDINNLFLSDYTTSINICTLLVFRKQREARMPSSNRTG